jgi:hypothetical protein
LRGDDGERPSRLDESVVFVDGSGSTVEKGRPWKDDADCLNENSVDRFDERHGCKSKSGCLNCD